MRFDSLRDAYLEFIDNHQANLMLMLDAGKGGISVISFESAVRHFLNTRRRAAFGRQWSSRKGDLVAIGFIEHIETNLHMHLAIRALDQQLRGHLADGAQAWKRIRHAGAFHLDYIQNREDYARYITKGFWRDDSRTNVFVYS